MKYTSFSRNGEILPIKEAVVPFETVEAMYGFGVYETIKLRNGIVYFLPQHIERLFHSASQIDLIHQYSKHDVEDHVCELTKSLGEPSANIKVLLMGTSTHGHADLYIFPSAPYYPNRTWYREGVGVKSFIYERWKPQAKSLNMLPSYWMYQKAQAADCYDGLLIDTKGNVREGTRTNVYFIKDKHIFSPPKRDVLEGVTMKTLEKVIEQTDFTITYTEIPFESIFGYDGIFLTSTSTKIIPVRKVDEQELAEIPQSIFGLISLYNVALDTSGGIFENLS